jgi:hypothetical protein
MIDGEMGEWTDNRWRDEWMDGEMGRWVDGW